MLGIISTDWRRMTVKIPKGSTITVVNGYFDGGRIVDILWEGDTVMILVQDLGERGTLMGPAPPSQ